MNPGTTLEPQPSAIRLDWYLQNKTWPDALQQANAYHKLTSQDCPCSTLI